MSDDNNNQINQPENASAPQVETKPTDERVNPFGEPDQRSDEVVRPQPVVSIVPPAPEPPKLAAPAPKPIDPKFVGLRGALLFFMICMCLTGLGAITATFAALAEIIGGDANATSVILFIGMPVVAVSMLMAAVKIGMRKRSGKKMAIISTVATAVVSTIVQLASLFTTVSYDYSYYSSSTYRPVQSGPDPEEVVLGLGGIVCSLAVYGLLVLYFQHSRRVNATLTEE